MEKEASFQANLSLFFKCLISKNRQKSKQDKQINPKRKTADKSKNKETDFLGQQGHQNGQNAKNQQDFLYAEEVNLPPQNRTAPRKKEESNPDKQN